MPPQTRTTASEAVRAALCEACDSGLLPREERLLVGVSGGGDSVALLHGLRSLVESMGLGEIIAGHVDHGLREDSADDALAVRELCASLGLRFEVERVRVGEGGGLQAAARKARYAALESMRARLGAAKILTAHTADDQAETVLLRISRGTSPSGLGGIRPDSGFLARPLLRVTRDLLAEYCHDESLPVRADPSNEDPKYLRVRARREILPLIESRLGSGTRGALCRLAAIAAEEDALLDELAGRLEEAAREEGALRADRLKAAPAPLVRRVLVREWRRVNGDQGIAGATPAPTESAHIERMHRLIKGGGSSKAELPGGVKAVLSCGLLMMGREPWPSLSPLRIEGPGAYDLSPSHLSISAAPTQDEDRLPLPDRIQVSWPLREPLLVRGWLPGDRLEQGPPVAELLLRARVPRPLRPRAPVVLLGSRLIWVPGIRSVPALVEGPALTLRSFSREGTATVEG